METNYTRIFYAGIAYGAYPEDGRKLKREGLPIKKLGREFPYLLGEGCKAKGRLQVYYALLPEYRGKALLTGRVKTWKGEAARRLLGEAGEKAVLTLECREQLLEPALDKKPAQVPIELVAVCLYCQRPFDKLCVTLPADGGEHDVQQIVELLGPYLPRMRQVIFIGDESMVYELLEDYLYGEFGIVMTKSRVAPSHMPWLDMGNEETELCDRETAPGNLRHINRLEILKFLDTAVKNGYNTEVN